MKKTVLLLTIVIVAYLSGKAQNLHEATVLGVVSIGNKDIATINELSTGYLYKTTLYQQGLLIANELVNLDFNNNQNEEQAKVVKPNLNQTIFAFKETNNEPNNNSGLVNPYEFVGVNHNLVLEAVGQDSHFPDITPEVMYGIIQEVIKEKTGSTALLSFIEVQDNTKLILNIDFTQINRSVTSAILGNHSLTTKQVQLLDNLFDKIITAPNTTSITNSIKGLENSLAVRNDLTNDEKIIVFIAYSVARNSGIFWEEASTNTSNP
ncbi:MAG: hypothetical protein CO118_06835, partial [Flavobacteriales bacterium CG_4_9_14_3_um_filter_32_8]